MSDRQSKLFDQVARRDERRALDSILTRGSRGTSLWRLAATLIGSIGSLFGVAMFLWASVGHLFLQPRFTYAEIFGTRQGETTGVAELAAAPKKIEAANRFNRGTAGSEAEKQNTVIRETTTAKAEQNATVNATAISRNARLEAAANCVRNIRSEAATRRAACLGTGTAGAECEARGELVEALEGQCGSLELPSNATSGEKP